MGKNSSVIVPDNDNIVSNQERIVKRLTNACVLALAAAKRTDSGLDFSWETNNPGQYPTYGHIGFPPVIGSDGIIYSFYEDPTLADAPITLPGQKADWTTSVTVPEDAVGLYILVSVESKQQKNFTSHAIDITGQ